MPKTQKIAVLETMQFFEVPLPEGAKLEDFANSQEARKAVAQQILDGHIDFEVQKIIDENRDEVFEDEDDDEDDGYPSDPDEELEYLERLEQQENAGAA